LRAAFRRCYTGRQLPYIRTHTPLQISRGTAAGGAGQHTIPGITHGTDSRLLTVIPGSLEFATMDHVVHLLLAVIYLIGGFMTRADVRRD
jgi:hypothetical protein